MNNRAKRREREMRKRNFAIPAGRVRDLACFFSDIYGNELTDDNAGRDDFLILAHHVARLNGDPQRNIRRHAQHWCPWMSDDELDGLVRRVLAALACLTSPGLCGHEPVGSRSSKARP